MPPPHVLAVQQGGTATPKISPRVFRAPSAPSVPEQVPSRHRLALCALLVRSQAARGHPSAPSAPQGPSAKSLGRNRRTTACRARLGPSQTSRGWAIACRVAQGSINPIRTPRVAVPAKLALPSTSLTRLAACRASQARSVGPPGSHGAHHARRERCSLRSVVRTVQPVQQCTLSCRLQSHRYS